MRCGKMRRQLALYAGGDLPADEEGALLAHIQSCAGCAAEYESLVRSRTIIEDLVRDDRCDEPPPDFAERIINAIRERERAPVLPPRPWFRLPEWRMAAACCSLLIILASGYGLLRDQDAERNAQWRQRREEVLRMAAREHSEIVLSEGRIIGMAIEGPHRIVDWKPPECAGVYALLHKPDPKNRPDTYIIDYLGESDRLTMETVSRQAGAGNDTYIAVYRMEDSSGRERQRIAAALTRRFSPQFN